jgi:hypothetical protein
MALSVLPDARAARPSRIMMSSGVTVFIAISRS